MQTQIARPAEKVSRYAAWLRSGRFSAALCAVLLVLQPVLFYRTVLIRSRAHIPFDIEGFHLPLTSYVAQAVHNGVAPFWDPYVMCGMPIHADLQAQVFYPPTWLAILGASLNHRHTLYYFVEWLDPLHMILAGLFSFLLLRRMGLAKPAALMGASVYQLGGYFASQAQHLCAVCTGAWLPLLILCVWELRTGIRRRWVAVLGLAIAMTFLSGFAATTNVAGFAMLVFIAALFVLREAGWKILPGVALGCLLGALISTVELAPVWSLTQNSIASLRAEWYTTGGGLPLQSLVSLVWPDYYHIFEFPERYKSPWNFTFLYVYCGAATVVLLAMAPFVRRSRAWVFLILTAVSALWMVGENTPVYKLIFPHLPRLLRGSIYAEYALMAFCFFAGITAAEALNRAGARRPALLWSIALFTSADLLYTGSNRPMNTYPGGFRAVALSGDFLVGDKLRSLADRTFPPARVDYTDNLFYRGILGAGMLRVPTPDSNNPFLPLRLWHVRELYATGQPWAREYPVTRYESPLLRMQNVGFLSGAAVIPPERMARAGLTDLGTFHGYHMYGTAHPLPRFYTVPEIRRSLSAPESVRMLAANSFDPAAEAIVEGIPGDQNGLGTADVKVDSFTPNRVQLAVSLDRPGFLASSETMYPGWTATINGTPHELLMTNGAFRGLAVPAGNSRIVMTYQPQLFFVELTVSLLALAGAAAMAFKPVKI